MAQTSSHYLLTLIEQAKRIGLEPEALLHEAGINAEVSRGKNKWVDNEYITRLLKILWRECSDETLGIDPQPMRMGSWGLACDYMLTSENLGDLYRRGQRIYGYLPPESMGIELSFDSDSFTVAIKCYEGERDPHHFLVEFLCVVWHRFPCWAIDEYLPVQRACFSYPEPAHSWLYDELLQCDVLFDQAYTGFTISNRYLSKPILRSKMELQQWLHNSPADLLYLPGRDRSVASYIKSELSGQLQQSMQFPAFDAVCGSLHMSPQVVRRRLSEEGSSYQKIKDAVRLELVCELLAMPDLPIAEITERAGFTEPAALSRAFKKWTGMTPSVYRQQKAR